MKLTITSPPPTPIEAVTDIVYGVAVTDPYRWLEDPSSLATRNWLQSQIAYARTYMEAISGRERIRKRVEELLAVGGVSVPFKVGNRYFFSKRSAHQEQPEIPMREGLTGVDISLIDPAERREGSATAVGVLQLSPDGRLLAYAVRQSGEDTLTVEMFDVNRRTI